MINRTTFDNGFWLIALSIILGLAFDLMMPLGVAVAVVYVIPTLMTYNCKSDTSTYITTVIGIVLTGVGLLMSPEGGEQWKVLANRLLAVMAMISVAFVIIKIKHKKALLLVQTRLAKEAEDKAHRASMAKSRFLSSMSHELRTPLNSILGFSQLLQSDDELNEDQLESVNFIYDSGHTLLNLVSNVLEFSELQDSIIRHQLSEFNIDELIFDVINQHTRLADSKGVTFNVDKLRANPTKTVHSEPQVISLVITAMINNAVQYNRDNGTVTISSFIGDDHCRITIRDTGVGIEQKYDKDIFQPFLRLGMESSAVAGMGLALSKAKVLIESLNGSIGFIREQDGSTFFLEIPY